MQKWEYLIVEYFDAAGDYRPQYINRQQLPAWTKGPLITEHINTLGEEGWELITAPQEWATYTKAVLFFKRPKLQTA